MVIDPASRASLDALLSLVPGELYYVDADAARDALRRRGMFNVIDLASGWKVDLIVKKDRAFSRSEFERRIPMTVLGIPVFVASPRGHIVAKLESSLELAEEWAVAKTTEL